MRRRGLPAACLIWLFCCAFSLCARAAVTATPLEGEERPAAVVTALWDQEELTYLPSFTLALRHVPSMDGMDGIYELALGYQSVRALVADSNGTREEVLSVAWDFEGIDTTAVGAYAAVGTILSPEGCSFGPDVPRSLIIPVNVEKLAPATIVVVEPWYPYTDAVAVLQGSDIGALEAYFSSSPFRLECYDASGKGHTSEIQWDFRGIDTQTVGLYEAVGSILPPENTVFGQDLALPAPTVPVSVQAPGQPDINCFFAGRGSFLFPWVCPPGSLDKVSVWLSKDGGPWQCLENEAAVISDMLSLSARFLTNGSSYRLQASYEGGQTGILEFRYDSHIIIESYHQGDRDGGDVGGNPPEDVIQPPPKPSEPEPSKPAETLPPETVPDNDASSYGCGSFGGSGSSGDRKGRISGGDGGPGAAATEMPDRPEAVASKTNGASSVSGETETGAVSQETKASISTAPSQASFMEYFGADTDRISGQRLFMMFEAGNGRATFSKEGITVNIPSAALKDTPISEKDQIEITIEKQSDTCFSIDFSVNGISLPVLSGMGVMVPVELLSDEAFFLLDEEGTRYDQTGYEEGTKTAFFITGRTGVFRLSRETHASPSRTEAACISPETQKPEKTSISFVPVLLLLSAGAYFLWKGRRN